MAPITLVVARAGILIEIAILSTWRVVLPGDAAVIRVFGIIAGTGAIGIVRVCSLVAIVVAAVPTFIEFALAGAPLTNVGRRAAAAERAARVRVRTAAACAFGGPITTDFDGFRAAACGKACEQAKDNDCPRSTLRHLGRSAYHLTVGSSTMR